METTFLLPYKHLHLCYLFGIRSVDIIGIKHDFLCTNMKDEGLTAPKRLIAHAPIQKVLSKVFFEVDEGIEEPITAINGPS